MGLRLLLAGALIAVPFAHWQIGSDPDADHESVRVLVGTCGGTCAGRMPAAHSTRVFSCSISTGAGLLKSAVGSFGEGPGGRRHPRRRRGRVPPEPARAQDEPLPCPDCNPPTRFWAGAAELMVVQFVPWGFTKWVTHGEWSNISFRTWSDNLKFSWQWDNNKFNNNQFAHPYHGSLYYNAGRANGYDFWHSAPWAFGGSLMWELFGEVWAPAPNDLANTTLGGITLGEMLFRFSSLVLDNRATGGNRRGPRSGGRPDQSGPGFQPSRPGRGESDLRDPVGMAAELDSVDHGRRLPAFLDIVSARRSQRPRPGVRPFRGELRGPDRGSEQEAVFRFPGLRHGREPVGQPQGAAGADGARQPRRSAARLGRVGTGSAS